MPSIIQFAEAIEATNGHDRALLIGNGFSAKYFSYQSLLQESGLDEGTPLRNLFTALNTPDFEEVVRALEAAAVVEKAYGNEDRAKELNDHAQTVREALVQAINNTHPKHREELGPQYTSSAAFLDTFSKVFTLNYDLLLYFVSLEKGFLKDGFGLGVPNGDFRGPFSNLAYCNLFNLHGGLHLFENEAGEIQKALKGGSGVISTITNTIESRHRFPIYVAEGTSAQKMRKINSVRYLRHCYEALCENAAIIFVYGHRADENDAHIYRAIFASKAQHIYFGIHEATNEKIMEFDGRLSKYQKSVGSQIGYTFFSSESANVWGTST